VSIPVGNDGLRVGIEALPLPCGPRSIAQLVEELETSDRPAIIDCEGITSYAELGSQVRAMAVHLRHLGIEPGDFVAASAANRVGMVIAFLAVQRIGAVWIGINPALAATEKGILLSDSPVSLVLVDDQLLDQVRELCAEGGLDACCVSLSTTLKQARELHDGAAPLDMAMPDPFAPAAIGYTSGTTGKPKGVVHSQHSMLVYPNTTATGIPGQSVGAGRYSVSISIAILNLMVHAPVLALVCGGACVLMDRADAAGVGQWIQDHKVESFNGAPTTFWDLLNRPDLQHLDLGSLKAVGLGGGPAPIELFEAFHRRFGFDMVGLYGLSEGPATNATSSYDPATGLVTFSNIYPSVAIAVLDEDGNLLPTGVEGELCIGPRSEGQWSDVFTGMLGYWCRPEDTAAAFHGRWLRTGDQAIMTEGGGFRIAGRKKEMILRGGANIYPLEVEAAIRRHPDVDDVVVAGLPDPRLGEIVSAFLKLKGDVVPSQGLAAALGDLCRDQLAKYKVPERWFVVSDFPRNALNKPVRADLIKMKEHELTS